MQGRPAPGKPTVVPNLRSNLLKKLASDDPIALEVDPYLHNNPETFAGDGNKPIVGEEVVEQAYQNYLFSLYHKQLEGNMRNLLFPGNDGRTMNYYGGAESNINFGLGPPKQRPQQFWDNDDARMTGSSRSMRSLLPANSDRLNNNVQEENLSPFIKTPYSMSQTNKSEPQNLSHSGSHTEQQQQNEKASGPAVHGVQFSLAVTRPTEYPDPLAEYEAVTATNDLQSVEQRLPPQNLADPAGAQFSKEPNYTTAFNQSNLVENELDKSDGVFLANSAGGSGRVLIYKKFVYQPRIDYDTPKEEVTDASVIQEPPQLEKPIVKAPPKLINLHGLFRMFLITFVLQGVFGLVLSITLCVYRYSETSGPPFKPAVDRLYVYLQTVRYADIYLESSLNECTDGYTAITAFQWPGNLPGCYCPDNSLVYKGSCVTNDNVIADSDECQAVNSGGSITFQTWDSDTKLCAMLDTDVVYTSGSCPDGYQQCYSGECVVECPITSLTWTNGALVISKTEGAAPLVHIEAVYGSTPCFERARYYDTALNIYPLAELSSGCGTYSTYPNYEVIGQTTEKKLITENGYDSLLSEGLQGYSSYIENQLSLIGYKRLSINPTTECLTLDWNVFNQFNSSYPVFQGACLGLCVIGVVVFPSILIYYLFFKVRKYHKLTLGEQYQKFKPFIVKVITVNWLLFSFLGILILVFAIMSIVEGNTINQFSRNNCFSDAPVLRLLDQYAPLIWSHVIPKLTIALLLLCTIWITNIICCCVMRKVKKHLLLKSESQLKDDSKIDVDDTTKLAKIVPLSEIK